MKKRFAIVGASTRGYGSYGQALARPDKNFSMGTYFDYGEEPDYIDEFREVSELVGVCDANIGRAQLVGGKLGVPAYDDFDRMLEEVKPDCVIVTTTDYAHAEYIIRALDAGKEVFTEKPMCINAKQCRAILEAEKRNNRKIGVCFNMRYMDYVIKMKELIDSGILGEIYNVHFEWLLTKDYSAGHSGHGASYYRRWNAYMEKCGGLLLTKSTHHFDFVNWLIGGRPKRVSAFGRLRHYGKAGAYRGERCSNCEHTEKCPYYYDIHAKENAFQKAMYLENEQHDGYKYDRCVFDEEIDSYDTMAINVEYDNGILMAYSESSCAMYEGFKMYINGSEGRMEAQLCKDGGLRKGEKLDFIRIIKVGDGQVTTYDEPEAKSGGHGGSDDAFRRVLFLGEDPAIESQRAGSIDGAYSILIGAAANESIATGKIIDIDEFIGDASLLDR